MVSFSTAIRPPWNLINPPCPYPPVMMNRNVQRYGIDIWRIVVVVRAELPGRLFLPIRGSLLACLCPRRVTLARLPVCHPSRHPYALRPRYAHSTYALSLQAAITVTKVPQDSKIPSSRLFDPIDQVRLSHLTEA